MNVDAIIYSSTSFLLSRFISFSLKPLNVFACTLFYSYDMSSLRVRASYGIADPTASHDTHKAGRIFPILCKTYYSLNLFFSVHPFSSFYLLYHPFEAIVCLCDRNPDAIIIKIREADQTSRLVCLMYSAFSYQTSCFDK